MESQAYSNLLLTYLLVNTSIAINLLINTITDLSDQVFTLMLRIITINPSMALIPNSSPTLAAAYHLTFRTVAATTSLACSIDAIVR